MTEEEKKTIVDAVIAQLKKNGTDISDAEIVTDASGISSILCYSSSGDIVKITPDALSSSENDISEVVAQLSAQIAEESQRAQLMEQQLQEWMDADKQESKDADTAIRANAMQYNTLGVNTYADKAEIYGRSITGTPRTFDFPAATTTKAGVMSAEDKNKLNSVGANEYDALSVDRRTDGFAYHMSDISLGSTYEGKTIARNTCSICEKITLEKGQKISYKSYAANFNAIIITDANNNVIFLSGAYTTANGEYIAQNTCYVYCTAYTNQISSNSYHCTVSASGMKATVERLESHVNILQSKTESFMQGYRELFVNGTLNVEMEQGSWIGFGEVGDNYTEKTNSSSSYVHYKVQVNQGTKLKYRLYAEGQYNVVITDLNDTILHKVGDSSNWQNHTGEYIATEECVIYINLATHHATIEHSGYYAILVDKDIRPRIDIKASDSEKEIWYKLRKARLVGDYDVYFEHATYTFKEIYDVWKAMNVQDYELPIGGGCNYYCNGSTFISVDPESGHVGSRATFGVGRSVQSFCIQDANIINIGGTYCFHDEGQNKEGYYLHKYVNCKMKYIANEHTTYLGKPLGGGMGLRGDVVIDNCYFENTNTIVTNGKRAYPVSWHGNLLTDSPCTFNLSIFNSVFVGGFVALGGNEKNQGDTNTLYLSNNNADTEPYISKTGNWTTYIWNNDTNAPNLALRSLFVAAGAEYNDSGVDITKTAPWGETVTHKAGHYYLNGLGDITEEQMNLIYANSYVIYNINLPRLKERDKKIRTIIPVYNSHSVSTLGKASYSTFAGCDNLEVLMWSTLKFTSSSSAVVERLDVAGSHMFNGCSKLRYVHPMKCTTSGNIPNMFGGCTSLIETKIYEVKGNISFSDSMMINKDSILCLIQNAVPTTAITITLHPDAYARLADDADIVAALEKQPLVSLVSA